MKVTFEVSHLHVRDHQQHTDTQIRKVPDPCIDVIGRLTHPLFPFFHVPHFSQYSIGRRDTLIE